MNLAIVGYRDFNNFVVCENFINETLSKWNIDRSEINKVISGGASGTDEMAKIWSVKYNIPLKIYYANWKKYGKAAGPIRNSLIIDDCTHVIAFPSKNGSGTQDTINKAKRSGKIIEIKYID